MTQFWWTEKQAKLDTTGDRVVFTDRRGAASEVGRVVADGAPGATAAAIAKALAGATATSRAVPFFLARKYGWPSGFCLAVAAGARALFLTRSTKPSYWYVLELDRNLVIDCGTAEAADALLARLASEVRPDVMTVKGPAAGTFAVISTTSGDKHAGAWFGTALATAAGFEGRPTYETTPLTSYDEASRALGMWIVNEAKAGHPISAVELTWDVLPLEKTALAELEEWNKTAAKAPAAKAPAKPAAKTPAKPAAKAPTKAPAKAPAKPAAKAPTKAPAKTPAKPAAKAKSTKSAGKAKTKSKRAR